MFPCSYSRLSSRGCCSPLSIPTSSILGVAGCFLQLFCEAVTRTGLGEKRPLWQFLCNIFSQRAAHENIFWVFWLANTQCPPIRVADCSARGVVAMRACLLDCAGARALVYCVLIQPRLRLCSPASPSDWLSLSLPRSTWLYTGGNIINHRDLSCCSLLIQCHKCNISPCHLKEQALQHCQCPPRNPEAAILVLPESNAKKRERERAHHCF